jgi:hypothetical protein
LADAPDKVLLSLFFGFRQQRLQLIAHVYVGLAEKVRKKEQND